jgi:phosphoribosylformimino-5-aminoimidazole carboxamide ribotide isomerase
VSFVVIPAVDIRGGRSVRLVQGDFHRETVYAEDPVDVALRWQAEGAERLHVVDLDGARDGSRANADSVRRLLAAVSIPVQVGGGIRALAAAGELLEQGAERVVVGTAAVELMDELADWVEVLGPERLVVGVDAKHGRVQTRGWLTSSDVEAVALCRALTSMGVRRVLYTDIERDGTLSGPNVSATRELVQASGLRVLASGGVSRIQHLLELAQAGAEGAIVGTALYDGQLSLREALAAC